MIAQELEVSLHMAFVEARQKRHEFITVGTSPSRHPASPPTARSTPSRRSASSA